MYYFDSVFFGVHVDKEKFGLKTFYAVHEPQKLVGLCVGAKLAAAEVGVGSDVWPRF